MNRAKQMIERRTAVVMEAVEPRRLMSGANIYNVVGTAGNDTISVKYSETSSGDYLSIHVNDQAFQTLNPSVAAISINGLGSNDTITYRDYRKSFWATFPVGVSGGTGDDVITLGSEGLYNPDFLRYTYMTLNGDAGSDRIVMDASMQSSLPASRMEISADYISPTGAVGSNYYGIERIDVKAPESGFDMKVNSLGAGTTLNVLNNARNSKLTIGNGDLDNFKGVVNFNGVSGNDTVVVDDSKDVNGRIYTLNSGSMSFNTGGQIYLNNSDAVSLLGTQGQGTYRVKSVGAGRAVAITPGKSSDLLDVGGGNYTANIKAGVTFWDDTANTGSVYINDAAATTADSMSLSGGQFSKPGASQTMWAFAKHVTLAAGNGANNITVTPSQTVKFTIDGNSQAAGTADKLTLNVGADTAVRTGSGSAGSYLFASKQPIVFQEIEQAPGSLNLPTLSIEDRVITEGPSGEQLVTFTVSLSKAMFLPVSVNVAVEGNTAVAGQDFAAAAPSTLTFAAGEATKSFTVKVFGDALAESDESFFVKLSNALNADVVKAVGIGSIINDDLLA